MKKVDYSLVNNNTLKIIQNMNPIFNKLKIKNHFLFYDDQKCDISVFDIRELLTDDLPLATNINVLSAKDLFNIINIHSKFITSFVKDDEEKNNNEAKLDLLREINPVFNNITIRYQIEENKKKQEYINIIDNNGKDHIFHNSSGIDLVQVYKSILKRKNNNEITFDDFYSECLKSLRDKKMNNASSLANDKSVPFDKKGNDQNESFKDKQLISEDEFYHLMDNPEQSVNNEEKKIESYNNYMEDLIIYSDYLLPNLQELLKRFENKMINYQLAEENQLNNKQLKQIDKYKEMLEKKDNFMNMKVDKNYMKLSKEKAGNISSITIVWIILSLIVSLAVITFIVTR